jgi:hypothetical protein
MCPGDAAAAKMLDAAAAAPVGLAIYSREYFDRVWPLRELRILVEQKKLLPVLTPREPAFTFEDLKKVRHI